MIALLFTAPIALAAGPDCATITKSTASSGTITLTEKTYENGMKACWQIAPPLKSGQRLRLSARKVQVEKERDLLQVYDARGALLDGDVAAGLSFYDLEGLLVRFTSDESITDLGFELRWVVESAPRPDGEAPASFGLDEVTTPGGVRLSVDLDAARVEALFACGFSLDGRFEDRADAEEELAWMSAKCGVE